MRSRNWESTAGITCWCWVRNISAKPVLAVGNDIVETRCIDDRRDLSPRPVTVITRIALFLGILNDLDASEGRHLPRTCTGAACEGSALGIESIVWKDGTSDESVSICIA